MFEKDTDQLFAELKIKSDIEKFIVDNQSEFTLPLHKYLNELLQKKKLSKSEIIHSLNFDKKYAYHIFSGVKKLLRYGGYAVLYPRDPFDAVIISAIEQNLTPVETDRYLEQLGELTLSD